MYKELGLWEQPGRNSNVEGTGQQIIFKPEKVISTKGKKDTYHAKTEGKGSTVTVTVLYVLVQ
jgi:hypothetical protein